MGKTKPVSSAHLEYFFILDPNSEKKREGETLNIKVPSVLVEQEVQKEPQGRGGEGNPCPLEKCVHFSEGSGKGGCCLILYARRSCPISSLNRKCHFIL
jgi:hypothetical protein